MEYIEPLIKPFVLYFVVIDPIETIALFLTVFPNIKEKKTTVAYEGTFYAFLI